MSGGTGITTIASHDRDAPAHIADKVLCAKTGGAGVCDTGD